MPLPRLYRFPDLRLAGVPYTRQYIGRLERAGKFPQHVDLGDNSIAWVAPEIDGWVEERVRARKLRSATEVA